MLLLTAVLAGMLLPALDHAQPKASAHAKLKKALARQI